MRTLVLMRHGKTEARAPSGQDVDRPLTPRGRNDARLIAEALSSAGVIPGLALVSGAQRTRETWAELAPVFADVAVEWRDGLYNASASALMSAFDGTDAGTVVVIAHNPGVGELAAALMQRAGSTEGLRTVQGGFPTSAAAVFTFDGDTVQALALYTPKPLGGGA